MAQSDKENAAKTSTSNNSSEVAGAQGVPVADIEEDKAVAEGEDDAAKSSESELREDESVEDEACESESDDGESDDGESDDGAADEGESTDDEPAEDGTGDDEPDEDGTGDDEPDEDELNENLKAEAAEIFDKIDTDELAAQAAEALTKAQEEAADWKDKFMRLHAEWDTYRRRTKEQRSEEKARAAEKLVTSLLPVLDDLERTIDYAEKNGEEGLLGGVQAVLSKMVDILQKDGVELINPKGEAFDALEAQAVGTVEDADQFDETVADVYQKGYKMGGKVLRPAMVTVTTGGPARPKEEAEEETGEETENKTEVN